MVLSIGLGWFCLSGDISDVWRYFGCHNWGVRGCYWHLVNRVQGYCLICLNAQDSPPTTEIDLAPNVQSDHVEKFWKEEPISIVTGERKTDKNLVLLTKGEKEIPARRGNDVTRYFNTLVRCMELPNSDVWTAWLRITLATCPEPQSCNRFAYNDMFAWNM